VGVGNLRRVVFSMRGLGWIDCWCVSCFVRSSVG
jgi:hypothetical protein